MSDLEGKVQTYESTNHSNYDLMEIAKRAFKYLMYALVVGAAVKYVPSQKLTNKEILTISIIASITFAVLDMYTPSVNVNL